MQRSRQVQVWYIINFGGGVVGYFQTSAKKSFQIVQYCNLIVIDRHIATGQFHALPILSNGPMGF